MRTEKSHRSLEGRGKDERFDGAYGIPFKRRAESLALLARWLGPWADSARAPHVRKLCAHLGGPRNVKVAIYRAAHPRGVYFVAPGLHFLGPDDPRLDRFCATLANAGFSVVAPYLPDFLDLSLAPTLFDDGRLAFDAAREEAQRIGVEKVALFSISFGSAIAIDLLSDPDLRSDISGALLFGGFCDFGKTVRFAATGQTETDAGEPVSLPNDPLNHPVVFANVLPFLSLDEALVARIPEARVLLARSWKEMCHRTWGRMELKDDALRMPFARAIADTLEPELGHRFLMGCGLAPGAVEWLTPAIDDACASMRFLDPVSALERVSAPIVIVHGADDDVIPHYEADRLSRAVPSRSLVAKYKTGLYGHTGSSAAPLAGAAREAGTLLKMLSAMVDAPMGNLRVSPR